MNAAGCGVPRRAPHPPHPGTGQGGSVACTLLDAQPFGGSAESWGGTPGMPAGFSGPTMLYAPLCHFTLSSHFQGPEMPPLVPVSSGQRHLVPGLTKATGPRSRAGTLVTHLRPLQHRIEVMALCSKVSSACKISCTYPARSGCPRRG